MADKILLDRSLYFLKVCGMNPKFPGFYARLKHFCLVTILTFNEVLLVLETALNWTGTDTFENGIEIIFGTFQIFLKSITMHIFRREIFLELDRLAHFWPINKFGAKPEEELTRLHNKAERAFNFYLVLLGFAASMMCGKPFFTPEESLPLKTYDLCNTTNDVCYVTLYAWQSFHVLLMCTAVAGVDGLFFALVTHSFCQFRLIKFGLGLLKDFSESVSSKRLGELVRHHVLILDCVKNINRIFSLALAGQIFFTAFNLCTTMFLLSIDGFPPTGVRLFRYIPMLSMLLFQIFIYCLAGSKIVEESTSVADAAFSCPLATTPHYKLTRGLCLMIQRAHRSTKLSAAGLIDLNIETFGAIVRKSSSLYMAIQQLHSNELQDY